MGFYIGDIKTTDACTLHRHIRNAEQLLTRTRKGLAGLSRRFFFILFTFFIYFLSLNINKVMTMSLP